MVYIDDALLEILCVIYLILNCFSYFFIYHLSRKTGVWKLELPGGLRWNTDPSHENHNASLDRFWKEVEMNELDEESLCDSPSAKNCAVENSFMVSIPMLFSYKNFEVLEVKVNEGSIFTSQATFTILDDTKSNEEIKISEFRSFSYATREGLPRLVAMIYLVTVSFCLWTFLMKLPVSTPPAVFSAIGITFAVLIPIFTLEYRVHYFMAFMTFGGNSGSIYWSTFELWNWNANFNIFLGISACCLTLCFILTPKFYVFEWVAMLVISSWNIVAWILMQTLEN